MKRKQPAAARKIARERIAILFDCADAVYHEDPALSDLYVLRARTISMKQRVRIDRELRRRYCHRCHAFLVPGSNLITRVHRGKVIATCNACGNHMRYIITGKNGRKKASA
jgi:ribonuclease P protein subunit RPR2